MFQARRSRGSFRIECTTRQRRARTRATRHGEKQGHDNDRAKVSCKRFEPVTFDLYRDIHKGIRAELFAVTTAAGSLDPGDRAGRADLARHVAQRRRAPRRARRARGRRGPARARDAPARAGRADRDRPPGARSAHRGDPLPGRRRGRGAESRAARATCTGSTSSSRRSRARTSRTRTSRSAT